MTGNSRLGMKVQGFTPVWAEILGFDANTLDDKFFAALYDAGDGILGIVSEFAGPFAGIFHHVL